MRHHHVTHIPLLLLLVIASLVLLSCDRTPHGVMSVSDMSDLIVDLQLAEAYIENHPMDFPDDSSKLVIKQSVFKKHGITQQDYDTSLVWYAHNVEDYTKAYDKAIAKLQQRHDKLASGKNDRPKEILDGPREPTHGITPRSGRLHPLKTDIAGDSVDLWEGRRSYTLTQGYRRGFIPFDLTPDAHYQSGDRYQLSYLLCRGGNDFKVCLNVDYTDGSTSQVTRSTYNDGWVTVDVQSDTTRHVRRVYGYVSYDIKRGCTAHVDSLSLMRTHLSKSNYGFIHAQRLLERNK